MGLSRLNNFLKSARGTVLYVNPNDLDATDSIENQGNSLTRPFKTIQRALVESARFSYQKGLSNDRFNKTTIILYPGDHIVDNRPGWIPDGEGIFLRRDGTITNDFPPYDLSTNFDLTNPSNQLYKLNSIHGGVIIPRGTSIVGLDLRKTKIRPKYVPNPLNDNIEKSTIFRVTGGCYFWQFSLFDADPNGQCYIDYTSNLFVPNFSHHKLSCFEYADGVNEVSINDEYITGRKFDRTDLEMYYEKVGLVYGQSSGRPIEPDYPSSGLDIQPKIDEYRIVGSTGFTVGIASIISGDGITPSTTVTVTTEDSVPGLDVDTPFRIEGVTADGYDGQFVVTEKISDTIIKYQVQNEPTLALSTSEGATLTLQSDTVSSASPYIFNISLRSVYGMCGILADGDKATGFKSMVIAQFTGIGLQKDDRAFVIFDEDTGLYQDSSVPGNETLSNNSRSVHKPEWRNYHIKAVNDAFVQNVSIFAIGYAEHFVTESGGDMSITNSNSNFGSKALIASGFKRNAFPQDDLGYITHIIPPKEVSLDEFTYEFNAIDVAKTISFGSTGNLYLYGQTNSDVYPDNVIEGYRIGARQNDRLNVLVSSSGTVTEYSSRIVMPESQTSSEKSFNVTNNSSNVLTIGAHTLTNGEKIRFLSDIGKIPDGLLNNQVYYVITNVNDVGIGTTQIKVAKTLSDSITHTNTDSKNITFNTKGGALKVISRVSDKISGDIGHPIQFDSTRNQWYVRVASASTENGIYNVIVGLGTTSLGEATSRTYIKRKKDNRSSSERIYRVRYVIPKDVGASNVRPPSDGYILQESNTSIGSTDGEIQTYFGSGSLSNVNDQRNFRFIANANWQSNTANVSTELPHNLTVGSQIEIINVESSLNPSGIGNSGFNGTFSVTGISSTKHFSFGLLDNPGTFANNTSSRDTTLPYFKKKEHNNTYYILRNEQVQNFTPQVEDGIYYLTVLNSSVTPSINYFGDEKFSQNVKNLYPQLDKDNPVSDPIEAKSFAQSSLIGETLIDEPRNSITKETISKNFVDVSVGVGITNIVSTSSTIHTIHTSIDHGLNRITKVSIANSGLGYGFAASGDFYNARLVGIGTSITGNHATAKITVNASGNITNVVIMDGGSAYGIGNSLAIVGVSTFAGFTTAYVNVTKIYNNVGDSIRINGVSSETYSSFNNLYRITGVSVGAAKSFSVQSSVGLSTWISNGGIGSVVTSNSSAYLTGETLRISSLTYDRVSGIATVVTQNRHGLKIDSKIRIGGANQSLYNGDFVVTENVSLTSFKVKIGIGTISPTATGTLYGYRGGVTSNEGIVTIDNENLNGRMTPIYAGITTTLYSAISDVTTESITLSGIDNLDVRIGDYFAIDDEIVRVKSTVPNNISAGTPISVFRSVLGTKASTHISNSIVRKIRTLPVELRRHSISRASSHTFEYVGFGPGNYSTAFPDRQDRQISPQEELLGQSTRKNGGINFYTGMNDKGISYSGNKKLSTVTGQEEIFDTPIQTITGEDISDFPSINVISAIEGNFGRAITISGGSNKNSVSEFNGPVIFTNKLTSSSPKGIEAYSLYLQGDAVVSRKFTVGISTPTTAGNPGDVVYLDNPTKTGFVGWIYTKENAWFRFGAINEASVSNSPIFDTLGINTITAGANRLLVNSGTNQFSVTSSGGVGIGTTDRGFKLNINGNANISGNLNIIGILTASNFVGDGSLITNLSLPASGWTNTSNEVYNTDFKNVGIGTSVPRFAFEVGAVGMASTSIYVNGQARFVGLITANNVHVSGIITATSYNLQSSSGRITAGIITSTNLVVGTSGTALITSSSNIGIGTLTPRAKLDVEGLTRLKTFTESVTTLTSASNFVTIDLSVSQTFELTLTQNINYFVVINPPANSSSFTIKITQASVGGYTVDLDDFRNIGLNAIPVYWPGGGVIPTVTSTANRSDIYSFRLFDGNNMSSVGMYAVVVGQNFVN